MTSIETLPAEVLCEIANILTWEHHPQLNYDGTPSYARYHSALARSCRRLYEILNPLLYKRNIDRDAILNSCILWAAQQGQLGTIKIAHGLGADLDVVKGGIRDIKAKGWNGIPGRLQFVATPLHLAIRNEHLDIVEYLLENGADVHVAAQNFCECTRRYNQPYALHIALQHGGGSAKKAAAMLIRHGAYLVMEGEQAAEAMGAMGHQDLVQLLLEQRRCESTTAALHYAIKWQQASLTQQIISCPELDASLLINGSSALGLAVGNGNEQVVRALLDLPGVDPVALDGSGSFALYTAAACRNIEIIHILLGRTSNTNVNATDVEGRSALHSAAEYGGNVAAIKALLQYPDININLRDNAGKMPLHVVAEGGNHESIRLLLNQPGAQHVAVDNTGMNLLHYLAMARDDEDEDDDDDEDGKDDDSDDEDEDEGGNNSNKSTTNGQSAKDDKMKKIELFVRELLDLGICINQESTNGTALRMALQHLNFPGALALLACGSDPTIGFEGTSRWTMLHECLKSPANKQVQTEVVTELVRWGVDVNVINTYVANTHDAESSLSEEENDDVEVDMGGTSLFFAAGFARNLSSMKVLLNAGADPNAGVVLFWEGDPENGQPYVEPFLVALARKLGTNGMKLAGGFALLVEHGARLDDARDGDKTALEDACRESRRDLGHVRALLEHATSANVSLEHVERVIDDCSTRPPFPRPFLAEGETYVMDNHQRELVDYLIAFRHRVFPNE